MADEVKLPYNLKQNTQNFLLDEVFHTCRSNKHFDFEAGCFIMVVDENSIGSLNSFVGLDDLMEKGIACFERLELKRKRFAKMHAIYFITQSLDSIDLLAQDFEDPSKPMYGYIHLIFSNGLSDSTLNYLMTKKNLVPLIVNLKVINLQYRGIDETTYTLGMKDMLGVLYSKDFPDEREKAIDTLADSISTILLGLKDFYDVQLVYSNSSKGVAKPVAQKLSTIIGQRIGMKTKPLVPPSPVTLVIMDRILDYLTPLKHDLYYNSLLMDLLHIKDNKYEHETVNEKGEKTLKLSVLNEHDSVWMKFRKRGFAVALSKIVSEFETFRKTNSAAQMQAGEVPAQEMNIEKLSEIIRTMPAYQDLMSEFTFHVGMLEKAMELYNRREIGSTAATEAILCSGVDAQGKPKTVENIKACNNCEFEYDKVRLALMMVLSEHCQENAAKHIKDQISGINEAAKTSYAALQKLGADFSLCGLTRKEIIRDPENKLAENDRCHSKIAETIFNLRTGKDNTEFDKISLPQGSTFPDIKFKKGALLASKIGAATSLTGNSAAPIFIVCVLGGISVNEIRELRSLEDNPECLGHITLMGGTSQHTPIDFVKDLMRVMGPLKEDIEEMQKKREHEEWLKAELEKDKADAEKAKNGGKPNPEEELSHLNTTIDNKEKEATVISDKKTDSQKLKEPLVEPSDKKKPAGKTNPDEFDVDDEIAFYEAKAQKK